MEKLLHKFVEIYFVFVSTNHLITKSRRTSTSTKQTSQPCGKIGVGHKTTECQQTDWTKAGSVCKRNVTYNTNHSSLLYAVTSLDAVSIPLLNIRTVYRC